MTRKSFCNSVQLNPVQRQDENPEKLLVSRSFNMARVSPASLDSLLFMLIVFLKGPCNGGSMEEEIGFDISCQFLMECLLRDRGPSVFHARRHLRC